MHQDHVLDIDKGATFGDCQDEGLQVFGDKNNIGRRETNLTDDQGGVDEVAEVVAIDLAAHTTKRGVYFKACVDQKNEAPETEKGNAQQDEIAEHHTSVQIRTRQEQDTGTDERF